MSTEDINIAEDGEMAACDGEKVVTMMDVLKEQQDFEEDANAVLGASDDKNCTYAKGYIKRQAIYACLTCCPDASTDPTKRAGVCLACSLNCHESHDLVELYTKRNFRCDCGNPNFNSHPCQFTPNKPELNDENIYNQNFSGLYCTCQRPYPDPEATFEDDMIQCIICEDWLHSSHLETVLPANDQYAEMICKGCMNKNEFLHDYSSMAVCVETVDIITVNGDKSSDAPCNGDVAKKTKDKDADTEMLGYTEKSDETELLNGESQQTRDTDAQPTAEKSEENKEKMDVDTEGNKEGKRYDESNETKEENKATSDIDDKMENADSEISKADMPSEESTSKSEDKKSENMPADSSEINKEQNNKTETTGEGSSAGHDTSQKANTDTEVEAIEKLLEEPNPTEDEPKSSNELPAEVSKNNENSTENQEPNDTDISKKDDKSPDGTTEMTEETLDESNDKENKVESDKNVSAIGTADSTSKSNTPVDSNVVNESANNINKVDNSDISNEKEALNETDNTNQNENNKRKLSTNSIEAQSPKKAKVDEDSCKRPKGVKKVHKGATFWPSNFRQKLCTCAECISMYKDLDVLFLTDQEDTVSAYESLGKEMVDGRQSQYEKGLEALSSLDRIQQINALTEYNRMRDKLLDFLKSFKDRRVVVKEEDIKAFFAGMKPTRESDGVYFCR